MKKPSLTRVMIKDVIDFMAIFVLTLLLVSLSFGRFFSWTPVPLSLYFPEQVIELFLRNSALASWWLMMGFVVTILYYPFCLMVNNTTLGGTVAKLKVVQIKSDDRVGVFGAILLGLGAYVGVVFMMMGPLYAWWLDPEHRGFSEKIAGVSYLPWSCEHEKNEQTI